ncbi:MAG: serine/threonine-protein kinase [Dokdonella sp.]
MTTQTDAAIDIARRIADGEAVDLSDLQAQDPDLARRLGKLQSLALAMNNSAEGGARWGHLQQLQLAGQGGFGAVYRAYDPTLDRTVALKLRHAHGAVLLPSGVDFVAEARRLARVRHPNVLAVHGASYHEARAGLWTDWIDGETLGARIARSGPLRGEELLRVLRELADALGAVHQAGLVHGDVKASNVMLDAQGRVILMDFGAGFESSGEGTTISAGTPRYLAPEITAGGPATLAVDLYAYGVLAHLLATNRYPDSFALRGTSCPRRLRPLIARLLDADPLARPRTDELRRDLKHLIDLPRLRVRRWLLASVVVGLSGIALVTAIGLQREQMQRRHAERVSDFLATLYREQDPMSRNAESARSPAALIGEAVGRVKTELAGDTSSQAMLLRVLGEAQLNLSEVAAAKETLDLAASKRASDGNALLGAEIDALRGAVARRELRNDDAERFFAAALREASAAAGTDSVAVGRINALSAATFLGLSRFKDAQIVAESAYALLSKKLGDEDPETISALVALAAVEEQLRQDKDALAHVHKVVGLIEKRFGIQDARLVRPLLLTGELLRRARDFPEARAALDRGADISRRRLGEISVQLADILTTRARVESEAADFPAAIAVLDAAEHALPPNEVGTLAQLLATRGKIWIELKDGKRAEPDLRKALKLRRETGGLRTGIAWFSQAELGWALALQGRFDEAHALLDEAEVKLRELLGPDAYQNALIAVRRAMAYQLQQDWPKAVPYFRESIRIEEKFFGSDHYLNFSWSLALAQTLSKSGDSREESTTLADALIRRWGEKNEIAGDYAELMLLRCDLHAGKRDYAAARALALKTLQHPGLIATAEQLRALKQHAGSA